MPNVPVFPSIPVPKEDVKSLNESVLALKQAVEMLTGQDAIPENARRYAPHVFMQRDPPEALHIGDLWLCTATTFTFNFWNGERWLVIATLPVVPPVLLAEEPDLAHSFARRQM